MKKILIFLLLSVMLLSGCDDATDPKDALNQIEVSVIDITPKNAYYYTFAEDCGEGCLYKANSIMWYYNYKYKISVPFCPDPSCEHKSKTCTAYLPGRVFGYKDGFIEVGNEIKWESENCVDDDIFVLEKITPIEGAKREIMRLDNRRWCDTYAYGDKLYIGILEEYHLEGDDVHQSSPRHRVYLMVVSLDTMETDTLSDCLMDGFYTEIHFLGANGGKVYFDIKYSTVQFEKSGLKDFIDMEQIHKYMIYDAETNELYEYDGHIAEHYFDGCAVYFDGKNVTFDCGDKIYTLTSSYELPYFPLNLLQFTDKKVYFSGLCEDTLFIFDTQSEKITSISHTGIDKLLFVSERENEFIFANSGSFTEDGIAIITELPKSECIISEVTRERYNELCKYAYEAYYG